MTVTKTLLQEYMGPEPKAGDKMAINWLLFIDTIAASIKILFGNCQTNVERRLTAKQAADHLNWQPLLFPRARREAHLRRIHAAVSKNGRDQGLPADRANELADSTIDAIRAGRLTPEVLEGVYQDAKKQEGGR